MCALHIPVTSENTKPLLTAIHGWGCAKLHSYLIKKRELRHTGSAQEPSADYLLEYMVKSHHVWLGAMALRQGLNWGCLYVPMKCPSSQIPARREASETNGKLPWNYYWHLSLPAPVNQVRPIPPQVTQELSISSTAILGWKGSNRRSGANYNTWPKVVQEVRYIMHVSLHLQLIGNHCF